MEPVYKPSTPIALIKSFESTTEVSSYYIQWLIGKSLSPNVQSLKSVVFKAGYVEIDDDDSTDLWLKWRFEYYIDEETKLITIGLSRRDRVEDPNAHDVPIVCRLAIMNKFTGITKYNTSEFIRSTIDLMSTCKLSVDEARDLDLPNGSYAVYCWLDMPKKVISSKPPFTCDPRGTFGSGLIASGVASLFDEVVSSKTDESTGTSDIVLITEKGVPRKERRFNCHRAILTIRSPVFNTMLTSKRFKEGNDRDVDIEDVTGDVFQIVLKYIYTGACPSVTDFSTIRQVVDVAEKYMLPELKDECVRLLINCDTYYDEAWADYLALSETYNIDYLKKISILALSSNIQAMMGDKKIREKLSNEAMVELADMAAKRWVRSVVMQVKNSG